MSCEIIFWGNPADSRKAFYIKNKIISVTAVIKWYITCRILFKKCNILPLASKFLLPLLFVVDNMNNFQTNSDTHIQEKRYNLHVRKH
jgi:hypothetical protein